MANKPTQEEMDKVDSFREQDRIDKCILLLEDEYKKSSRIALFRGVKITEEFTKKALLGVVIKMCEKAKENPFNCLDTYFEDQLDD